MNYSRRAFLASGLALVPLASALAQSGHDHHGGLYERLQQPGRIDKPEVAAAQNVFDSPAPKAANPGRWMAKAPLPLPRSEMAWATECTGRLHLVGGYAEQRVDRPYHHVYDPASDRWTVAAPLPRGANHVGVVCHGRPTVCHRRVHRAESPAARRVFRVRCLHGPLGADRSSARCLRLGRLRRPGRLLHGIGGAIGDTSEAKRSVDWHLVYDPKADRWEQRAPLPTGRDHIGASRRGPHPRHRRPCQ